MVASQHAPINGKGVRNQTRPTRTRRRGAAVVELAIVVPLLSLLALGVVEYSQFTHAAQIVSNASRRGARFAAKSETTSVTSVDSYIKDFITGSFNNLTAESGNSSIVVNVSDGAGVAIANGDLSATNSGTPIVVDVSFEFDSIRLLHHFGILDQQQLQTSTVTRRE